MKADKLNHDLIDSIDTMSGALDMFKFMTTALLCICEFKPAKTLNEEEISGLSGIMGIIEDQLTDSHSCLKYELLPNFVKTPPHWVKVE